MHLNGVEIIYVFLTKKKKFFLAIRIYCCTFVEFYSQLILKVMRRNFIFAVVCFFSSLVLAQNLEKAFFENNPTLGGDVTIKSASLKVVGEEIYKTFEIESMEAEVYYLDAWMLAPLIKEVYPEYKVEINGTLLESTFKPQKESWQSLALTDVKKSAATVKLKKGKNSVSVIGKSGEVAPMVDFIKLSINPLNRGISDKNYKEFVEKIKSNTLIDKHYVESQQLGANDSVLDAVNIRRGTAGETYNYAINMPVYYTALLYFYWGGGENIQISTSQSGSFGHIIEFFQRDNPVTYSWVTSSTGSGSLNITTPISDWYILRVCSNTPFTAGTVDVFVNNTTIGLYQSFLNCAITGSAVGVTDPTGSSPTNYFTCKLKNGGDTWLFLEEFGYPGRIVAHNHNGGTRSDGYNWNNASLITTSRQTSTALVSAFSSALPSFQCDVYANLPSTTSTLNASFPDLTTDNSFISGPATGDKPAGYNCIDWTVGITAPANVISMGTWNFFYDLNSWDNFYNTRGYTRSGITASTVAIALWQFYNPFTDSLSFSHASVRKNSTIPNPHGFEWESKLGSNFRVMHTWYALNSITFESGRYGTIYYYYRPISGVVDYSMQVNAIEAENNISSRSSNVQQTTYTQYINNESRFSQLDLDQIASLKDCIPAKITNNFEIKYLEWEKTWSKPELSIHSDPIKYSESNEYNTLLNYCEKYGKSILPLIIDKLAQGNIFVISLLKDLTSNGNTNFITDITKDFKIEDGKQFPSLYSILVDYCKKILINEQDSFLKSIQKISAMDEEEIETIFISVHNQEILLNLHSDKAEIAFVKIYIIFGVLEFDSSYIVPEGGHTLAIDVSNFKKGVYVILINIGGKTDTQKINI